MLLACACKVKGEGPFLGFVRPVFVKKNPLESAPMPTKPMPPRTIHIELEGLVSMLEMAADFHYDADALVDNIADIEKGRLPSLINSQTSASLYWHVLMGNCVARCT